MVCGLRTNWSEENCALWNKARKIFLLEIDHVNSSCYKLKSHSPFLFILKQLIVFMGKKLELYFTCCMVIMLLFYFTSIADGVTNITTDQDALLALKAHITRDPSNLLTANWSTATSPCNWVGVTCGARHGRVTKINFSHMGLTGTIPLHLGNLSFLRYISLYNNSFYGSLPTELAKLPRMVYFGFAYNYFTGEIPSWIGSFTRLQTLSLASNKFKGMFVRCI